MSQSSTPRSVRVAMERKCPVAPRRVSSTGSGGLAATTPALQPAFAAVTLRPVCLQWKSSWTLPKSEDWSYTFARKPPAFRPKAHKYNAPVPGTTVQSEKASFKLEPVIESGLDSPWAIAFLPDGRQLVTERPGRLRIIENGKLMPEPVRGVPAVFGGEGGLLDVALHPSYSRPGNDWIYLSYGDRSPGGLAMTAVIRGRLRDGALVDQQQIFKADDSLYRAGGQRFGSRLLFDGKGHLFFSIGDRACPGDEQDLSQPNGKVHRVNEDGSIPKDNPFVHHQGAIPASGLMAIGMPKVLPSARLQENCGSPSTVPAAATNSISFIPAITMVGQSSRTG